MKNLFFLTLMLLASCTVKDRQTIDHIWLSYNKSQPSDLIISWESVQPGGSKVLFYEGDRNVFSATVNENVKIHHVEVPVFKAGTEYRYKVITGESESEWYTFRSLPRNGALKIVVFADWGYNDTVDLTNVYKENPDFIATCGDNVPDLFEFGNKGDKHCINSYLRLVGLYPELFRHIPFMPALGNHDHQLYPRGPKPPADHMVYDTLATAFREFFELPCDEWKWQFRLPEHKIRFLALDLNHIHDYGNNWQTCHAYHKNSPQYKWYVNKMSDGFNGYTVTLMNANNPDMRRVDGGIWNEHLKKSSLIITGSGYYAEKAIIDSVPFLNTSLVAGDVWPDAIDPKAEYSESISTYILLTVTDSALIADFKTIDGKLYDRTVIKK